MESSDAGGEGEAGTFHVASAATRLDGPRPAAVATGIGLSGAILAAMYLLWPLAKQAPVFGLFTRIRRSRALEHPVRKQLHDAIENSPGIHLRELTRLAERGQGAVRHHLQKLEQSGLVRRSEGSGYVCFFPMGATRAQVASAAVVKSPVARRMLQMAAARPGVTAREVADGLGVAPATASYHVKRLREAGLLSGDRDRNRIRLQATRSGCQAAGFLAA